MHKHGHLSRLHQWFSMLWGMKKPCSSLIFEHLSPVDLVVHAARMGCVFLEGEKLNLQHQSTTAKTEKRRVECHCNSFTLNTEEWLTHTSSKLLELFPTEGYCFECKQEMISFCCSHSTMDSVALNAEVFDKLSACSSVSTIKSGSFLSNVNDQSFSVGECSHIFMF